jgi:small subunit ribosomal protein S6
MGLRRLYETTFIVNAALEDQDIEAVINKVSNYIENHGGEIQEVHRWGRRRLAYPINKKFNGFYVHIIFESNPNAIPILERFLVLEDTVLRHLTLILPKKLFNFRKQRALRDGKAYSGFTVDTPVAIPIVKDDPLTDDIDDIPNELDKEILFEKPLVTAI